MSLPIKRIALSTGGGDAPGLNAVIRAATLAARNRGWDVVGIRDGFNGIMFPEEYPNDDGVVTLTREGVRGIVHQGGTILGTTNRGNPTAFPVQQADGTWIEVDRSQELIDKFHDRNIDALVTIGGDGSLTIGHHLYERGLRVIGVPKTIDNDLEYTSSTFGFHTAVDFASQCIDRLFSTATSHGRVIVVEVMGRYAGWIALHSGVASGAHAILIPEIEFDLEPVAATISQREDRGARFSIVVVAEGARPKGGEVSVLGKAVGQAEKLGGIGQKVADGLSELTGKESRVVVLGHLIRGGTPTAHDRLLGLRFGAAAVRALEEGHNGIMVALNPPTVDYVPLASVTKRQKSVPIDCDTMLTARDMGINFGDEMPIDPDTIAIAGSG
jgi:ATP-dependent phosphofructokinase / diphosphate-dependent phosphofructokinase